MPPTTRLQSRVEQDSSAESDSDSSESVYDERTGRLVFPSKLTYSLERLDAHARQEVKDALDSPTQLVLQDCVSRGGDQAMMIFEVTELVDYTIRTGTEKSQFPTPDCSCDEKPTCRHILWLFDQVSKQVLDDDGEPLTLTTGGYAAELGRPYDAISDFHLDVLAESLHSQVSSMTGRTRPNPRRVQEVREILASLNSTPIDEYRPDLFHNPRMNQKVIKRRDLEGTIFRMLLRNNEFFHYFLSSMRTDELVNNPFRRLQQRADAAFKCFDAYAQDESQWASAKPKNAVWCSNHLVLIMNQVHTIVAHAIRALADWKYRGAARVLVHILEGVAVRNRDVGPQSQAKAQRNLFFRLIGDKDRDFVLNVFKDMPPNAFSQLIGNLEQVLGEISKHGPPVTYVDKLANHIKRSRSSGANTSGSKRQGGGQDRSAKRMK
ncbi:uncharacterized protein BCR38DRAFT_340316 [Pseudomassariella vexata]|uniref:SWIM-type domain-containing protein n=1 Tax=Pseudomassariella vexata TaxID=1141098 RepID=A0A1Y2E3C6_9PEZI|nr:uncharacterized protein BCR38DRAFT_340316 [Pseudomassariella vexata]ORY65864.1 hypothetical protein BCR38DRAFT_340316 [Pseudomassariella vexata]